MISDFNSMKGKHVANLHGVFFHGSDGWISDPISLLIKGGSGTWLELSADGSGKVRSSTDVFKKLYYDATLGYSFVAPLLISLGDVFAGNEIITEVSFGCVEEYSEVSLTTSIGRILTLRFEDDEVYVSTS
jgi:hypothetical protein